MAYIEWKKDNSDVRMTLLYFLELYISSFEKEYYFTKSDVSSAKKLKEMFDEYSIDPLRYVFSVFSEKKKHVEDVGFRFFNSLEYRKTFLDKAFDRDWFAKGVAVRPCYDKVRKEVLDLNRNCAKEASKPEPMVVLMELMSTRLSPTAFFYLLQTGFLRPEEHHRFLDKLILAPVRPTMKKVDTFIRRGVLPPNHWNLIADFPTFAAWAASEPET